MISSFKTSDADKLKNLNELIARQKEVGGKIMRYEEAYSFILIFVRVPCFALVEDDAAARKVGKKHAMTSAIFGWWSLFGLFVTPAVIFENMRGGRDVTPQLTLSPEEKQKKAASAKKRALIILAVLVVLFAAAAYRA
jgi:hypothetical protein